MSIPVRDAAVTSLLRRVGPARDFLILLAGGAMLGSVGVLVRLAGAAGVGPFASAFWRMALAAPVLAVWAWLAGGAHEGPVCAGVGSGARREPVEGMRVPFPPWSGAALVAFSAAMFAGDLILFHLGLVWSTVANATLESNLAPVVIVLGLWAATRTMPPSALLFGLVAAMAGALLMIGPHFGVRRSLLGDACGLGSALFYAAYQVGVQRARQRFATLPLMALVTVGAALALAPFAWWEGRFWPRSPLGWLWLAGLAVLAQICGQVVIAYAVKHLSPARASIGLLVQPVTSAVYAWALLGERLSPLQGMGAMLLLGGIYVSRR